MLGSSIKNGAYMFNSQSISKKYIKILKEVKNNNNNSSIKVKSLKKIITAIESIHKINLFDAQILSALALIDGNVVDMKTGEGKTYSGLLAACYLAFNNHYVHIVSTNTYLTERDFLLNEEVFKMLNIDAAYMPAFADSDTKSKLHSKQILYITANQLGFDYLRDNHALSSKQKMNVKLDHAIIDEADSVLLDQASAPLINSKAIEQDLRLFAFFNDICQQFIPDDDFKIDIESKKITLNEDGFKKLESIFITQKIITDKKAIYSSGNTKFITYLENALRAHHCMKPDIDYVLQDNSVLVIDRQTHRILPAGQRWSNGLHQAVEVKEGLTPAPEQGIESSISLQNFFRLYDTLSAMSGTALIDKDEFKEVYNLNLVVIPENTKNNRIIKDDMIFTDLQFKNEHIINLIKETHKLSRPMLIATTSVKESEIVSRLLDTHNISHKLINAKNPDEESNIISNAGKLNAVTVATNMAGRGTDIILGGSNKDDLSQWKEEYDAINQLGGLFVIGYGRSDLRRIDEQLSGRCARQGDNGSVQFFLSLDDPLAETLPKKNIKQLFGLLGLSESEGVFHPKVSHSFTTIQNRKESFELESRKKMLMYDDILQKQRNIYYSFRSAIFHHEDTQDFCKHLFEAWAGEYIDNYLYQTQHLTVEQITNSLKANMKNVFQIDLPLEKVKLTEFKTMINNALNAKFEWLKSNVHELENFSFNDYIKSSLLFNLDNLWSEYFQSAESLKNNVNVRSTAQKNPYEEFSKESFIMFEKFTDSISLQLSIIAISSNHITNLAKLKPQQEADVPVTLDSDKPEGDVREQ
jgi:preprotein translocase subunit SecA